MVAGSGCRVDTLFRSLSLCLNPVPLPSLSHKHTLSTSSLSLSRALSPSLSLSISLAISLELYLVKESRKYPWHVSTFNRKPYKHKPQTPSPKPCRAKMVQIRQSRQDCGLSFRVKNLEILEVLPLRSATLMANPSPLTPIPQPLNPSTLKCGRRVPAQATHQCSGRRGLPISLSTNSMAV